MAYGAEKASQGAEPNVVAHSLAGSPSQVRVLSPEQAQRVYKVMNDTKPAPQALRDAVAGARAFQFIPHDRE